LEGFKAVKVIFENGEFWIQNYFPQKSYVFCVFVEKLTNGGGGYNVWLGEGQGKYTGTYPKTAFFLEINMIIFKKI